MRVLVLLLTGCLLMNVAQAASFDCAKAASPTEKLICGDDDLSNLDEALHDAYVKVLGQSPDKQKTRAEQRQWLNGTLSACNDVKCLQEAYQKRLAELVSAGYPDTASEAAPAGDGSSSRETFLHIVCSPKTGVISMEPGITAEQLPRAAPSGQVPAGTLTALEKRGYYSVQRSNIKGSCTIGKITYKWYTRFHEAQPSGACMAAEFTNLWFESSAGEASVITIDGELCPPDQDMLRLSRLKVTPKGRFAIVCASGNDPEKYGAAGKTICRSGPAQSGE